MVSENKLNVVYKCPNLNCKDLDSEFIFQKSTGFQNPYNHLNSFVADGSADQLIKLYDVNAESKRAIGKVTGSFKPSSITTPKEQALHDLIHMIVCKNQLVSIVEDKIFRDFRKHVDAVFSVNTVKEIMLNAVELVYKLIAAEMKQAGLG